MHFAPPVNYSSPGAGLPSPVPQPMGRYRVPRKRKRRIPKNPWFRAYSGDVWKRPYAHEFYRFTLYHRWNMDMCRVDLHTSQDDPGSMRIDAPCRVAGPEFKRLALEAGLRPVKRPNKFRTGPSIDFWDWPPGFVKD